jgi:3D (Asp-Asp-Asp) domain-containing protein
MLLSRSLWLKVLATLLGSAVILLIYQATVIDSRSATGTPMGMPPHGARLPFVATAYCKGEVTASGVTPKAGVVAADPRLLPVGSVVQIDAVPDRHDGIYTVLDTGPKVQGRHVDLYMWSCHEALAFGRRQVALTVLRHGWKPNGTK